MKPTYNNFKNLCKLLYILTGDALYFNPNIYGGLNWFERFYKVYNELKKQYFKLGDAEQTELISVMYRHQIKFD